MKSAKQAFICWTAGTCYVIDTESRKTITHSKHFRRATRKARRFGYDVRVYNDDPKQEPTDARDVGIGSYVLPAVPA